jgi:hypothetical protein
LVDDKEATGSSRAAPLPKCERGKAGDEQGGAAGGDAADGTGADVPEFQTTVSFGLYGGIDVLFAKAGIEGGVRVTAEVNLNDPNDDGKLRLTEALGLVVDTGNPLGYVEVPRIFLAPGWQPSVNFRFSAEDDFESRTTSQESDGGAEFFDIREGRRVVRFSIGNLPEDEAMAFVADIRRRLDKHGQLFWIQNPDDVAHMHRRAFLGRFRQLTRLELAAHRRYRATFEISEVTA